MFVPKRSSLRYRIDRGDFLGVIWLSLGSVAVAEIAGRARPDAIVLDLQHGLWDRLSLEAATGVVPP
jgi:2-keto-3-deoxy-L-rhamnonate aldolase RhmA